MTDNEQKRKAIYDYNGQVIISFDRGYDEIIYLQGLYRRPSDQFGIMYDYDLFRVRKDGKYGIVDLEGNEVVAPIYDDMDWSFTHDLRAIRVKKDGLYGYIDTLGSVVFPIKYKSSLGYLNGYVVAQNAEGNFGLLSKKNELLIPFNYSLIFYNRNDESWVVEMGQEKFEYDLKTGAIIPNNTNVSDTQYTVQQYRPVYPKSDGEQAVEIKENAKELSTYIQSIAGKNTYGYKDAYTGQVIIPAIYDGVSPFIYQRAIVYIDGFSRIIDENGNELINKQDSSVTRALEYFVIKQQNPSDTSYKVGLLDNDGNSLIPLVYDYIEPLTLGRIHVQLEGKSALMNQFGEVVIPFDREYTSVSNIQNIIQPGALNDNKQYLGEVFQVVMNDGLGRQRKGLVTKYGVEIVPVQYDEFRFSTDGVIISKKNGQFGLINMNGQELVPHIYSNIVRNSLGTFTVETLNGKFGIIGKDYNTIVLAEHDLIKTFDNGMVLVKKDDLYGYLNSEGETVIPVSYQWASEISDNSIILENDGIRQSYNVITGQYTMMETLNNGSEILDPTTHDFSKDQVLIQKMSKYGPVNQDNVNENVITINPRGFMYHKNTLGSGKFSDVSVTISENNISFIYNAYNDEVKSMITEFLDYAYASKDGYKQVVERMFHDIEGTKVTTNSGKSYYKTSQLNYLKVEVSGITIQYVDGGSLKVDFTTRHLQYDH